MFQAVVNRCLVIIRTPDRKEGVTDIYLVLAEACAAFKDAVRYRSEFGEVAAKACFAIDREQDLKHLASVFAVLGTRDEKLIPALARAQAILQSKLGRG